MLKLKINEKNLIANLSHAFTSKNNLFTELAQNSRRAQANAVHFTLDKDQRMFMVEDDGLGISNFQNLLTVAESGWDYETAQAENPFGMGFLIAIYLSDAIEVESLDQKFSATKAEILQGSEIKVTKIPFRKGTKISLKGVTDKVFDLKIENIFSAFQIPVFINKKEIPRPNSKENLLAKENMIHHSFWFGDFFCNSVTALSVTNLELFFQGFEVSSPYYRGAVIHLKESEFKVRMPDRDSLIDAKEQIEAISATVAQWQQEEIKKHAKDFDWLVANFKCLEQHKLLNLFNAFDQVPNDFLKELVVEVPWCSSNRDQLGSLSKTPIKKVYTKQELLREKIISHFYTSYDMWDGSQAFAMHTYLSKFNTLILSSKVPEGHWIKGFAKDYDDAINELTITPIKEIPANSQPDFYTESFLKLCEEIELNGCFGKVIIDNHAITYAIDEANYETLVPKNETTSDVVAQICNFQGEYSYDETLQYQAEEDFQTWLQRERLADSPEKVLEHELKKIMSQMPALKGKTFKIKFTSKLEAGLDEEDDQREVDCVTIELL